jgi:hypothetical protein
MYLYIYLYNIIKNQFFNNKCELRLKLDENNKKNHKIKMFTQ